MLVLALAVYGVYQVAAPLDVQRPSSQKVRPIQRGGVEPIPSRLWEDPFLAYQRAASRATAEEPLTFLIHSTEPLPPSRDPSWRPRQKRLQPDGLFEPPSLVLAVVAQSGSYPEDAEDRKRSRYAVLSALGDSGYRAVDGEHIGAFAVVSGPLFYDGVYGAHPASEYILPFERFRRPRSEHGSARDDVLVVWVPDRMLGDRPLRSLHGAFEGLWNKCGESRLVVLGPTSSSALVDLVSEKDDCLGGCPLDGASIISCWATISDPELRAATRGSEPKSTLLPPGVSDLAEAMPWAQGKVHKVRELAHGARLFRQTETDEALILTLKAELARRGIDPGRHPVALVTEWNTDYGHSFFQAFKRHVPNDVTRFAYMQGIDGRIPLPEGAVDDDASSSAEDQEDPLGRRQTDYLRRLLESMGDDEFRAIGVVGSDVYDKLLVLRALKPHFPNALFFTTDLDVRFLDETERAWTRNLIVASHFGLDPSVELEREGLAFAHEDDDTRVLPMRGSYQTATFLGCMRALQNNFEVDPTAPYQDAREVQLFEVARGGAYNLGTSWEAKLTAWLLAALPALLLLTLFNGREVFSAKVSVFLGDRGHTIAALFFGGATTAVVLKVAHDEGWRALPKLTVIPLVLAVLVFRVWSFFRNRIDPLSPTAPGGFEKAVPRIISFACVVYLVVGAMLYSEANLSDGEPLVLFEGISIWPSVAIRVVVIFASASLLFLLQRRVQRWDAILERNFGLDLTNWDEPFRSRWRAKSWRRLRYRVRRVLRYLGLGRLVSGQTRFGAGFAAFFEHPFQFLFLHRRQHYFSWLSQERQRKTVRTGWKWYRRQGEGRLERSVRAVVLFSGLLLAAYFLEESHIGLARGAVARFWNFLTWWLALLGVSLLLFFVLDTTQTCCRLIRPLADPGQTILWSRRVRRRLSFQPDRAMNRVPEHDRSKSSYMDGLLDVRLAADLTSGISSLVWYPFGLLALLILAQNSFFENWAWTPSSITLFGILGGMLLISAARLRSAAEQLRRRSLERLRQFQLHYMMEGEDWPLDELDFAIDEVRTKRRGAFLPFAQHPIVAAILLPFGGVGTIAIFERFVS